MSAKDIFYSAGHEFSRAEARAYAREGLIYNVTEDVLFQMEQMSVTKQELARRLGKSRSYVTQLLSGARNMTLGSLADICFALDIEPQVRFLRSGDEAIVDDVVGTPVWTVNESEMPNKEIQVLGTNVLDKRDPGHWERVA